MNNKEDMENFFRRLENSKTKEETEEIKKEMNEWLEEKRKNIDIKNVISKSIKKDKNLLLEEQIKRIQNKGVKKEVDEDVFYSNLIEGDCDTCIKIKTCKKGKKENWNNDCKEWDYFLALKIIRTTKQTEKEYP